MNKEKTSPKKEVVGSGESTTHEEKKR